MSLTSIKAGKPSGPGQRWPNTDRCPGRGNSLRLALAFWLLASPVVSLAVERPDPADPPAEARAGLLALTPLSGGYLQLELDGDGDGQADQYVIYKILRESWSDEPNDTLQARATQEQVGIVAVEQPDGACPPSPPEPTACQKARHLYVVETEPVRICQTLPCEPMV